jgi:hypothetical protein
MERPSAELAAEYYKELQARRDARQLRILQSALSWTEGVFLPAIGQLLPDWHGQVGARTLDHDQYPSGNSMFVKREGPSVSVVDEYGRILWSGRTGMLPPECIVYTDDGQTVAMPVDRSTDAELIHAVEQRLRAHQQSQSATT